MQARLGKLVLCVVLVAFISGLIGNEVEGACASVTMCQSCIVPGACDMCNIGYGIDENKRCSSCSAAIQNCAQCNSTSPPKCTKCVSTAYGLGSEGATCGACAPECRTCAKNGAGKCDACNSGFALSRDNTTCIRCVTENCGSCKNATDSPDAAPTNCTSCMTGYSLSKTSPPTCSKCSPFCTYCSRNAPACDVGYCQPGYGLNNSTGNCDPCTSEFCASCPSDPNKCASCKPGYGISKYYFMCVKCVDNCSLCTENAPSCNNASCMAGYGYNNVTGTCEPCKAQNCTKCQNDPNVCTACQTGLTVTKTNTPSCVTCGEFCNACSRNAPACDPGYCQTGYGLNNSTGQCQRCASENCGFCSNDPNNCTVCKPGYNMTMTMNGANTCVMCGQGCKSCSRNPPACDPGMCLDNYGYDNSTGNCEPCMVQNCGSCSMDPKNCTFCKPGFNLTKTTPPTCAMCGPFCRYCSRNAPACDTGYCQEHYGLNNATGNCESCVTENCNSCQYDPKNCSYCKPGYNSTNTDPPTCAMCGPFCKLCAKNAPACDAGMCTENYGTNPNGGCEQCQDPGCYSCDGNTAMCKSCKQGLTLDSMGKCTSTTGGASSP